MNYHMMKFAPMIIGDYNELEIARSTSPGLFLQDSMKNEVLLPKRFANARMRVGQIVRVFVYYDSEDRIIATTQTPKIQVNSFGYLKVRQTTKFGAFLDWGLDKDLLVPFRLQHERMKENEWYIVFMYHDEKTSRLVATSKLLPFFNKDLSALDEGQEVELMIMAKHDLGLEVIINNSFKGLIYESDIYQDLLIGEKTTGYLKKIRDDGKIDVSLRKVGFEQLEDESVKILEELEINDGFLPVHDKSSPEDIRFHLEMSKKSFKRAVGILYKQKKIILEKDGIRIIKQSEP